jgi:polysaccharide deacetylase family protein (PEP-CTERM system associated)
MRRTTSHSWTTYLATLGLVCLFPLATILVHVPQPVALFSLGLFCIVASFAAKRSFTPEATGALEILSDERRPRYNAVIEMSASITQPEALKIRLSEITNAFSIDLEDYFHTDVACDVVSLDSWNAMPSCIERSTMDLLDILDKTETRATVFVLGWLARKQPKLVRHIHDRGHEIACHSDIHRRVSSLTPAEFSNDTRAAMESIQDAVGTSIQGYRAPSFSIVEGTEWAFDILAEQGFSYDSSVYPVYHPTYGNPDARRFPYYVADCKMLEIPVATWRLGGMNLPVGGGAYLRILPEWYIHAGIRANNQVDLEPAMIYIHPWEIDPLQPRLKLKTLSQLRQTSGLHKTSAKLERLLKRYKFAPVSHVYRHLIPQRQGGPVIQSRKYVSEVNA